LSSIYHHMLGQMKPTHQAVMSASALGFLAFWFSIAGLAGVWWSGSYETQIGRMKLEVTYVSTLWDSTAGTSGHEAATKIDEACDADNLDDDSKANCDKVRAVRAFIFLKFFAVLPAFGCPTTWLFLQYREPFGEYNGLLQKAMLVMGACCKAVAIFWALLAVIVAATLNFSAMSDDIGAGGAGFVLTILSFLLCLLPGALLECWAWKQTYCTFSGMDSGKNPVVLPKVGDLPSLIGSTPASKSEEQQVTDVEMKQEA